MGTVVGPLLTYSLMTPVFAVCIMYCGALPTNLAGSLDMIVAFVLSRLILKSGTIELINVAILFTLLLASVNFAFIGIEVEQAKKDSLNSFKEEVQRIRASTRESRMVDEGLCL